MEGPSTGEAEYWFDPRPQRGNLQRQDGPHLPQAVSFFPLSPPSQSAGPSPYGIGDQILFDADTTRMNVLVLIRYSLPRRDRESGDEIPPPRDSAGTILTTAPPDSRAGRRCRSGNTTAVWLVFTRRAGSRLGGFDARHPTRRGTRRRTRSKSVDTACPLLPPARRAYGVPTPHRTASHR